MAGAVTVVTVFTVVDTGRVETVDEEEVLPDVVVDTDRVELVGDDGGALLAGVVDTDCVELVGDAKVLLADITVEFVNGAEVEVEVEVDAEVLELVGTTDSWLATVAVDVTVTLDLNCGTELTAPEVKAGPGTGYAVKGV